MKPSELKPWMQFWGENLPDISLCERGVFQFIKDHNVGHENDTVIRYFDRCITFGEFYRKVEDTAKAYAKLGVKKGDIVTMCSVMTPETIYTFYAMDLLGAAVNLADPRTSARGLHGYIEEAKSTVVCALTVAYDKIKEAVKDTDAKHVIVISPADSLPPLKKIAYKLTNREKPDPDSRVMLWDQFIANAAKEPDVTPVAFDRNQPVLIVHTGGTTGRPKSVMLSSFAINALAQQMVVKRGERHERFLNVMPPFIAYGFGCGVHTPMAAGLEIIVIPKFDPKDFGKLLRKYRPQHTAGVPLHYQVLANDPSMKNADLSFLVTTGAGGDAISTQAEDMVNAYMESHKSKYKLCKGYGMTEVCAGVTACIKEINRRGSVGIPMYMTEVGIFEPETDNELDFNCEGEICVCSPTMMLGYYEMPEETENVIRRHSDGKLWVHTGDIGKMDEDGYLFIVNRIKRVIIRHDGFKVFPFAIEDVLCGVEGVENACAVAIRDHDHEQGNLPFVFVQAKAGADTAALEAALRKTCSAELAEYVLPVGYEFVEEMPHTNIGKVDYMTLQKRTADMDY